MDAKRNPGGGEAARNPPSSAIPAGTVAPDFRLHSTPDQQVSLSEFRGHPVILAFYPADFSPVCGDQMALYNEILAEFRHYDAQLLGISVDGVWCHRAFAEARKLHFPLLSDFEPKGAVARAYGAYRESEGVSERALFVLDGEGVVRWSYVSPMGVNPGADGILEALERLKAGSEEVSGLTPPVSDADHRAGPDDAPVTLVEYGDFECPHCGRAHPIVREVRKRMGKRLRFVYRHFPLSQVHPHAVHAAEAAEAAGDQGKFWEMHDALFENQEALEDPDLIRYAQELGLDGDRVAKELESHAKRVREHFRSGVRSGVNGTPTFFINGERYDGSWGTEDLLEALAVAAGSETRTT